MISGTSAIVVGFLIFLGIVALVYANISSTLAMHEAVEKIDKVYGEVKTLNTVSLANLADAGEKRRIDDIPEGDRTAGEKEFIEEEAQHDPTKRALP